MRRELHLVGRQYGRAVRVSGDMMICDGAEKAIGKVLMRTTFETGIGTRDSDFRLAFAKRCPELAVHFLRTTLVVATICMLAPTTAAQNPFGPTTDRAVKSDAVSSPSSSPEATDDSRKLFLQDDDGNFVPAPDLSYQQLIKLLEEQRGRLDPAFTVSSLNLSGQAEGAYARLTARIVVEVHRDGRVRVPLGFDAFVLTEAAKFQGDGEHFISKVGGENSSYTVWIGAAAGSRHEIQLDGLVSIASDGIDNRLRLPMVRAASSRLEFTLPTKNPDVEVTSGMIIGEETFMERFRRLIVVGIDDEFELYWKPHGLEDSPIIPLEVRGQIRVSVQQPDEIRSHAQLRIRAFEKPLRAIHIRLPPGNDLIEHSAHDIGYDVRITEGQSDVPTIVTINLAQPTDKPVDLDLTTRLVRPVKDEDGYVQVAGFQVLYALRQSGTITIENSNQWNLDWKPGPNLARTSDLPAVDPSLSIDATFEYYQQPCSLRIAARSRRASVVIDPTYLVTVSPQEIALNARLQCLIEKGSVAFLRVRMPGWKVQSVSCDDPHRIEKGQPISDETDPFVIRLAKPDPGQFTIDLMATLSSASTEGGIEFQLPRAEATRIAPANVVIASTSKMNLVPRDGQLVNLIPDPSIAAAVSPDFQRPDALYYRARNDEAIFAADVLIEQRPRVETHGRMSIDSDGAHVTQTILFDMPNDTVTLDAPEGILNRSWKLRTHDGSPLLSTTSRADDGHTILSVQLPEGIIDRFSLVAEYQTSFANSTIHSGARASVPLLIPLDNQNLPARIIRSKFKIESTELDVELSPDSLWLTEPNDSDRSSLEIWSDTLSKSIELTLSPSAAREPSTLLVDMSLLRTWLLPNGRYERAVFQLDTDLDSARIRLPPNVDLSAMDVELNGDSIPVRMQGDELIVDFHSNGQSSHVIVVSYPVTIRRSVGRIDLVFPRITNSRWTRRFVWQLLLPAREHLLVGPGEMTSEDQWSWNGLLFSRRPIHDLSKFESRMGVIDGPIDSPNLNRYTFSSLGGVGVVNVRTASRAQIVLFCSGLVLMVGLLSAYVSLLQNRIVLAFLLVALLAASFVLPAPTLLLFQGATLGIALLLLATFLRWTLTRRKAEGVLVRGQAFPGPATRSTVLIASQAVLHSERGSSRGSGSIVISSEK